MGMWDYISFNAELMPNTEAEANAIFGLFGHDRYNPEIGLPEHELFENYDWRHIFLSSQGRGGVSVNRCCTIKCCRESWTNQPNREYFHVTGWGSAKGGGGRCWEFADWVNSVLYHDDMMDGDFLGTLRYEESYLPHLMVYHEGKMKMLECRCFPGDLLADQGEAF